MKPDFNQERADVYAELVELGFDKQEAGFLSATYSVRRIRAIIFCVQMKNTWSLSTVEIVRRALEKNWTFGGLLSLEELSQ